MPHIQHEQPRVRFAGPVHYTDLDSEIDRLTEVCDQKACGYAGRTTYKSGRTTLALFVFRKGASLPRYSAKASVTITALKGRIKIQANGVSYHMAPGAVLTLDPGVSHYAIAIEDAAMFVYVSLESDGMWTDTASRFKQSVAVAPSQFFG